MPTTFQDDLKTVNVSTLRASGAIAADATWVVVTFGPGDDAHRRELRVVHRKFPNSGGWSFFVAACSWAARQAGLSARARHPEVWRALQP
jgi:hypothetical protein